MQKRVSTRAKSPFCKSFRDNDKIYEYNVKQRQKQKLQSKITRKEKCFIILKRPTHILFSIQWHLEWLCLNLVDNSSPLAHFRLNYYYRSTLVMNTATKEISTDLSTLIKGNSMLSSQKETGLLKVKTFLFVCFLLRGLLPAVG